MQWLRRNFITGFFVTVPLVVSVAALIWIFQLVDGLLGPLFARWLGAEVPGLGILATAAAMLAVGALASNVLGKRLLQQAETYLGKVPVFKTIYAPVKQLIVAFSPDNEFGFKRVVFVDDAGRGLVLGFLTREFVLDRGRGPEPMVAVYVPTNHLYLGDVRLFPMSDVTFPDVSVEQAIRVFLTGGVALPSRVREMSLPRESASLPG
ncbi:MAG: DUF502 domain-containing protein [Vicinamibacterales bacterium]